MDTQNKETTNFQENTKLILKKGFYELIHAAARENTLDKSDRLNLKNNILGLSQEFSNTVIDVAQKLQVPLEHPLDFKIWELPKGYDALVDEDQTVIFNLTQLVEYSNLIANDNSERAKAEIRKNIAHEFRHLADTQKYSQVLEREKNDIRNSPNDMSLYHLTRMEQSAQLYSIKYLLELEETDPIQVSANEKVANQTKKNLVKNLRKSRVTKKLGRLISEFSL